VKPVRAYDWFIHEIAAVRKSRRLESFIDSVNLCLLISDQRQNILSRRFNRAAREGIDP